MNAPVNIYDVVVSRLTDPKWLRRHRLTQRLVAQDAGVPFSTVCKIAQRAVRDPSVHKVQRLFDYMMRIEATSENSPFKQHQHKEAA